MINENNEKIKDIAIQIQSKGGTLYAVGGAVRDTFMGLPLDDMDLDFAVEGLTFSTLKSILTPIVESMTAEAVGKSFAVIKAVIDGADYDFALCRAERKVGENRQDFDLDFEVGIVEDLLRRDFTINAIAIRVTDGMLFDPFNGVQDINNGVLRNVSDAFTEDPLRVFRAARFLVRFPNFSPSTSLINICKTMPQEGIAGERIAKEFIKTLSVSNGDMFRFFDFLNEVGWTAQFKELFDLIDIQQSPTHHPEGDAYNHTIFCMNAAKDVFTKIVMFGHDLGKVSTTKQNEEGRWTAHGHELASVPLFSQFAERLNLVSEVGNGAKTIQQILLLIELHMLHIMPKIGDKKLVERLRRLKKVGLDWTDLVAVMQADISGRPPIVPNFTTIEQMTERVGTLSDRVDPIVTGQMIVECGIPQGPKVGEIFRRALDFQADGSLTIDNWKTKLKLKMVNETN